MQISQVQSCYQLRDYYETNPKNESEFARLKALHVDAEESKEISQKEENNFKLLLNEYTQMKERVQDKRVLKTIMLELNEFKKHNKIIQANLTYTQNQLGNKTAIY